MEMGYKHLIPQTYNTVTFQKCELDLIYVFEKVRKWVTMVGRALK